MRQPIVLMTACLVAWTVGAVCTAPRPAAPAATQRPLLRLAEDAARWVRASGKRTAAGLTWPPVPGEGDAAPPTLYSGPPGVVLFLLALHEATGRSEYLADAKAGADHLAATLDAQQEPGLYTGLAGIAFVLERAWSATHDARYRDAARRATSRLLDRATRAGAGVEWNDTTDIIGGSAGIGLFLLDAANALARPAARETAAAAGARLVELGRRETAGRSWAMNPTFARRMPNFSHGTAGVAYFLARLHGETGRQEFLDAALDGARYLQSIANTSGDICLVRHHEPQADGLDLFYLGWCHGPAGTARLFYLLHRATLDRTWLDWVHRSARGILQSGIPDKRTPGFWDNAGQCCGSAGVAEFFLDLYQATGQREYLDFARRLSDDVVSRATRDAQGARWVHAEHRARPEFVQAQTGWMQGSAGIGAWLLRLDALEQGRTLATRFPDSPF